MSGLHMIELLPDVSALFRFLKNQGIHHRHGIEKDPGYALHVWLKTAFGDMAPQPFRLLLKPGRPARILGYAEADADALAKHLSQFAEPSVFQVCKPENISSRRLPDTWSSGQRLGFQVLCCPVGRRNGIEKDVFLARADRQGKDAGLLRSAVYGEWLQNHLDETVEFDDIRLEGFRIRRHVRGTHPRVGERRWKDIRRPEALLSGSFVIRNKHNFSKLLSRGIGRHRAFGYGMLLLRPAS